MAARFRYLGGGPILSVRDGDLARLPALLRQQLVLVQEADDGTVRAATRLQLAGALDGLYGAAAQEADLGVSIDNERTTFKLWAPTARQVAVWTYQTRNATSAAITPMRLDAASGRTGRRG